MLEKVKFVHVLTVLSILIASAIMFVVMMGDDFKDSELRTQVVTSALGILALAAGYWFNSTNDSSRKTDLLAQAQPVEPK